MQTLSGCASCYHMFAKHEPPASLQSGPKMKSLPCLAAAAAAPAAVTAC